MTICRTILSGLRVCENNNIFGYSVGARLHSPPSLSFRVSAPRLVSTNATASSDVPQYDIVVVGAGLVGAAFTCALQLSPLTAGLKVALLDRTPLSTSLAPRSEGYIPNPRVTTITPASESFLKSFGGWSDEIHNRSAPFDIMQVWDAAGLGHVTYSAADAKTDVLGRVIENDVLQSSLHQIIKAMSNVDFLCTSLNSLELGSESGSNEGLALLELSDGTKAKARLVVGSDGNRSRVRQLAGIRTIGWRYNHHAVVSTVRTIDPITTAYQRFLPTGPIALLPSDRGFANVVWSTTPSHAARLAAMDAATFAEAVDDALASPSNLFHHKLVPGELLPKHSLQALAGEVSHTLGFNFHQEPPQVPPQVIDAPGKRGAFPLQLAQAARYIAPRVVLIGDAAHTVHPLGGQGVNLGFNDCRTLAQVLVETVQTGGDIGSTATLKVYERQQQIENSVMMASLDGIHKLFNSESLALGFIRGAGLSLINAAPPLKELIILHASGTTSLASEAQKRVTAMCRSWGIKLPTI